MQPYASCTAERESIGSVPLRSEPGHIESANESGIALLAIHPCENGSRLPWLEACNQVLEDRQLAGLVASTIANRLRKIWA